jgi:hypothetical protein
LLNNQCVIEAIREAIKRFLGANENENTTYQNLWDTAKAVLIGKFIAVSAYIKRTKILNKQPNAISQTPSKTKNKQKERNNKNEGQN